MRFVCKLRLNGDADLSIVYMGAKNKDDARLKMYRKYGDIKKYDWRMVTLEHNYEDVMRSANKN